MPKSQTRHNSIVDEPATPELVFEQIYERYAAPMFAFFYAQLGHRQDAEDLTALTFSEALRSRARYAEQGSFEAWLWSIARHKLLDAQRRRRELVALDAVASQLVDGAPSPEALALHAEHAELLDLLLGELPDDQRAALRLRFWGERSFGEIAERLGRSAGAAKMLVQRALATLRASYGQLEHGQLTPAAGARRAGNRPGAVDTTRRLSAIGIAASFVAETLARPLRVLQPAPIPVRACDDILIRRR